MSRWMGLVLLALSACDYGFRPETLLENLRLIGMRSTPADLAPGQTARLEALVLDPSRPQRRNTVLWLGCAPDPYNLNRSACSDLDVLRDSASVFGPAEDGGTALPAGVSVIGFNDAAAFTASAQVFDALSPDDPRRQTGTVGQVLAFAVAEEVSPAATQEELRAVFDRVRTKETRSVAALFRVRISESTERNTNPTLSNLVVGGERWPRGATLTVVPGEKVQLDADAPEASFEAYTATTPDGSQASRENLLFAWYSTTGRFTEVTTAYGEAIKTVFTAPGLDPDDPVPPDRKGTLYVVVRDTRGGQSWVPTPIYVCDDSLPEPEVTQVDWPPDAMGTVVLHGTDLTSVLDVVVDGVALTEGAYSEQDGTWQGHLPAQVPAGTPRGSFTTRRCTRGRLP